MSRYAQNKNLTQFNEGGLHSQNPLGGIPIGDNNSVEQGETKQNNFVYSNRIFLDKDVVSQYNLPKSLAGKSVADATKFIDNKFKGRNDKISQSTKNLMLSKIAEAQESMKPIESEIDQQSFPESTENFNQMAMGGESTIVTRDVDDTLQPDPINDMKYGNMAAALSRPIADSIYNSGDQQRSNNMQSINTIGSAAGNLIGGKVGGMSGNIAAGATGLYEIGSEAFGKSNFDTSGKTSLSGASAGKSAGAGALKGAGTGAAIGSVIPGVGTLIGAGVGAIVGGVSGFVGGKKDEKAQAKNNARYANRYNQQFSDQYAFGGDLKSGEEDESDKVDIQDKRKVRATTKKPINPKVDLVSGRYSKSVVDNIINASLKYGVDPNTALALGMQESKLGNENENIGQIVGGSYSGQAENDMVKMYNEKVSLAKKKGRKSDEEILQMYNGTGKIFPNTEKTDRGYAMKKIYGVPVPKEGIDMGKTNLYGVQVKDVRDNVIKKNPNIQKIIKEKTGNFNFFEGQPYKKGPAQASFDDPFSGSVQNTSNVNPKYFANGGTLPGRLPKPTINSLYPNLLNNFDINSEIILPNNEIIPTQTQAGFEQYYNDNTIQPLSISQKLQNLNKKAQPYLTKASDMLGSASRYAPIAANAYQLSQLKKPEGVRLNRLDNRYKTNYVDMAQQQNIVNQELNNTNSAIQQSGASQGASRNAILGAQLNKTKALSNAYMNAEAQNRQQDAIAQQFNLGVDQTNLQQSNTELDINDRNRGNYDTQKSRLIGQLGNDIGNVGKEEVYKKIAKTTTGYSWLGEYQKMNPDATPEEVEKAAKKAGILTDSTTKKALGGYLLKNKGK